jgi:hypothetical protein
MVLVLGEVNKKAHRYLQVLPNYTGGKQQQNEFLKMCIAFNSFNFT